MVIPLQGRLLILPQVFQLSVVLYVLYDFIFRIPDYIRNPPQTPLTPGFDETEGNALPSRSRISRDLMDVVLEQSKREIGRGLVGKLFDRQYRQSRIEKMQIDIDDIELHR
jgi:hypothetical protein